MTKNLPAVCLTALLGLTVAGSAHEGHRHNAMGTINAIDDDSITLSVGEDETVDFVLTSKTTYVRGDEATPKKDVVSGERAVVVYEKKGGANVAIEVKLAPNKQ